MNDRIENIQKITKKYNTQKLNYDFMSTSFYARIIPKEEDVKKLLDAINNNRYNDIVELTNELYGSKNDYTGKGGVINLGIRTDGWQFLWSANVFSEYDASEKKYINKFTYPLTKKGISEFIKRKDVIIFDEYNIEWKKQNFIDMAFNQKGLSMKSTPKSTNTHKFEEMGYDVLGSEFMSDGLRFSVDNYFC
jgi:TPP-dependent indolepyruvate ferredoxin oxidoreductase alpha subunit